MAMTCPVKGCHSTGWCVHKKVMMGLVGMMMAAAVIIVLVALL